MTGVPDIRKNRDEAIPRLGIPWLLPEGLHVIYFLHFCFSHAIFLIETDILLIFFQESPYAEPSGGW